MTGAVQQIYSTKTRSIEEQLLLRPFPIGIRDATERQKTFALYREELIAQAGIAVFVMGNKTVGGKSSPLMACAPNSSWPAKRVSMSSPWVPLAGGLRSFGPR